MGGRVARGALAHCRQCRAREATNATASRTAWKGLSSGRPTALAALGATAPASIEGAAAGAADVVATAPTPVVPSAGGGVGSRSVAICTETRHKKRAKHKKHGAGTGKHPAVYCDYVCAHHAGSHVQSQNKNCSRTRRACTRNSLLRENRTPATLIAYGFEVRTDHQACSKKRGKAGVKVFQAAHVQPTTPLQMPQRPQCLVQHTAQRWQVNKPPKDHTQRQCGLVLEMAYRTFGHSCLLGRL